MSKLGFKFLYVVVFLKQAKMIWTRSDRNTLLYQDDIETKQKQKSRLTKKSVNVI